MIIISIASASSTTSAARKTLFLRFTSNTRIGPVDRVGWSDGAFRLAAFPRLSQSTTSQNMASKCWFHFLHRHAGLRYGTRPFEILFFAMPGQRSWITFTDADTTSCSSTYYQCELHDAIEPLWDKIYISECVRLILFPLLLFRFHKIILLKTFFFFLHIILCVV